MAIYMLYTKDKNVLENISACILREVIFNSNFKSVIS